MIGKNVEIGAGCVIQPGVVIDDNVRIGPNCFIGANSVIRENVILGTGVVIGHLVLIEIFTKVGQRTVIQSQSHITAYATIGEGCYFGPCVTLFNEQRISKFRPCVRQDLNGPRIGNFCRIGTRSLIFPGVSIGDHSEVGAGSVITKDIGAKQKWFNKSVVAQYQGVVEEKGLQIVY